MQLQDLLAEHPRAPCSTLLLACLLFKVWAFGVQGFGRMGFSVLGFWGGGLNLNPKS